MFEQFRICFYYSCSVGLLPDWVFQNYVAHGVPSRPTNPRPMGNTLQRFRCKNSLTFSCSTPAESAVKGCALAYALKMRVDSQSPNAYLTPKSRPRLLVRTEVVCASGCSWRKTQKSCAAQSATY